MLEDNIVCFFLKAASLAVWVGDILSVSVLPAVLVVDVSLCLLAGDSKISQFVSDTPRTSVKECKAIQAGHLNL